MERKALILGLALSIDIFGVKCGAAGEGKGQCLAVVYPLGGRLTFLCPCYR